VLAFFLFIYFSEYVTNLLHRKTSARMPPPFFSAQPSRRTVEKLPTNF
jgi:hypothetical protein